MRRIQDHRNLVGDVFLWKFIKRFQSPDDLGDHQEARSQSLFSINGRFKQRFGLFRFDGIVVGQKSQKDIRVDKKFMLHGRSIGDLNRVFYPQPMQECEKGFLDLQRTQKFRDLTRRLYNRAYYRGHSGI